MNRQDVATLARLRWDELRALGVDCEARMNDAELQKYMRQLENDQREMAPIIACMEVK